MSVKNPTPKQKYRQLCELEPNIPIFSQAWWLDSVAGDNWDVILVEKGDTIQASLPFVTRKRFGLTVLSMPPLTQTLGPWMRPSSAKYAKQLSQEKDLLQALVVILDEYIAYRNALPNSQFAADFKQLAFISLEEAEQLVNDNPKHLGYSDKLIGLAYICYQLNTKKAQAKHWLEAYEQSKQSTNHLAAWLRQQY